MQLASGWDREDNAGTDELRARNDERVEQWRRKKQTQEVGRIRLWSGVEKEKKKRERGVGAGADRK